MPTHEETLKRLAATFTAKDIMTFRHDLISGNSEAEAVRLSGDHTAFDVIPIMSGGELTAYLERESQRAVNIEVGDLISDGTSLTDLVDIFGSRKFSFVLSYQSVNGYVHYSDLNHQLVKLTFYVLLEALQKHALGSIGAKADDEHYLAFALGQPRANQLATHYKNAGKAGRSLSNYLNISDILKLAITENTIELDETIVEFMRQARNGAAHVRENLVSSYADVSKLAQVKREALRILGGG